MSIFFWQDKARWGGFSNFTSSPIVIDDREWATVEHYFQAMKSLDWAEQEKIRVVPGPGKAKRLGRRLTLRPDWEQVRYEIMMRALRIKFAQPVFQELLLSTGTEMIYEDSPFDKIWGTGELGGVGTGQNLLGQALMALRAEIQANIKK